MGVFDTTYDEVSKAVIGDKKKPDAVVKPAAVATASGGIASPVAESKNTVAAQPSPVAQPSGIATPPGLNPDGSIKYMDIQPKKHGPLDAMAQSLGAVYNKVAPGQDTSARLAQNRAGLDSSAETVSPAPASASKNQVAPALSITALPDSGTRATANIPNVDKGSTASSAGLLNPNSMLSNPQYAIPSGTGAIRGPSGKAILIDSRQSPANQSSNLPAQPIARPTEQPLPVDKALEKAKALAMSANADERKMGYRLLRSATEDARHRVTTDLEKQRLASDAAYRQAQTNGQELQNANAKIVADLQQKALAGDAQAMASYRALTGKEEKYKDRYIPMNNRKVYNDMGQVVGEESGGLFDAATGKTVAGGGQQKAAASAPKAGEVRDGYKFNGGNPADKNSWEKA